MHKFKKIKLKWSLNASRDFLEVKPSEKPFTVCGDKLLYNQNIPLFTTQNNLQKATPYPSDASKTDLIVWLQHLKEHIGYTWLLTLGYNYATRTKFKSKSVM